MDLDAAYLVTWSQGRKRNCICPAVGAGLIVSAGLLYCVPRGCTRRSCETSKVCECAMRQCRATRAIYSIDLPVSCTLSELELPVAVVDEIGHSIAARSQCCY